MYAIVNKVGVVVGLATKDLGKDGFQYVETTDEIVRAVRARKSVKYADGAFAIVAPFRSMTWDQIRDIRDVKFAEADAEIFKLEDQERINALDLSDQKKSIALYREDLRDITDDFESPDDVVFPNPPF